MTTEKPKLALSIRQPWAHYILHMGKDIENRDWPTSFRGRIYVHAGKQPDLDSYMPGEIPADQFGAILGEVDIVDCVTASESDWFCGRYGFVLANPQAYETPIPCRGRLGLFTPEVTT